MARQTDLQQRERRVLDAVGDAEASPSRRPRMRSMGARAELSSFLILSMGNVIDHYVCVLLVHQDIENNAILLRLGEQERALRELKNGR